MKKNSLYLIAVLMLLCTNFGFSQELNQPGFDTNINSLLPPLQTLIDSAIQKNPEIRFSNSVVKANEYKLQSEKSYWTRNIGVQTDVRYGTFNNFSTNTAEGQVPSLIATSETQTNYGIGLYMKFPLYDLINRKNQTGLAKAEIEQAQAKAESQITNTRQMVILHYNDVIMKHNLFQNKLKSIETERINLKMVEEEFKNGITPVVEFARIHQIASLAEDDLERAKMEFITSYMILQEITGLQFNMYKSNNGGNENN